jgi:hypothetical protein
MPKVTLAGNEVLVTFEDERIVVRSDDLGLSEVVTDLLKRGLRPAKVVNVRKLGQTPPPPPPPRRRLGKR